MAPFGIIANVARAEDALGFRRERQQADGNIGLAEKGRELIAAVEQRHLRCRPRRTHPRGHREASDCRTSAGAVAIMPKPRKPTRRCSGRTIGTRRHSFLACAAW
jgi:hypothetical protein